MIDKTILHYRILEKLGEGGMGAVYLAEDTRLGRRVALKILPHDMVDDTERLKRFKREAKLIASLNHPNIVTLFSVEDDDQPFFTMELVEGKTVDQLIPEGGMTLRQFFAIAIPFADALEAAHSRGIAHRDLKPANIMVTNDGRVKVLDFGIAKLQPTADGDPSMATELTREGTFIGTPAYMAPEQVKGDPPDHRSDIFALGIILYQLATGRRPFSGGTPAEVVSSILRDEPQAISKLNVQLPNRLGDIVRRCLEKEPDERYQSAGEVRDDLKTLEHEIQTGQFEVTGVQAKLPRSKTGAARRPLRIAMLGVAAAAVIAATALWVLRPSAPEEPVVQAPAGPTAPEESVPLRANWIAVVPLENAGDSPDPLYSEGLTDTLAARLAELGELRVVAREEVEAARADAAGTAQIGRALGAAHVLAGTARWGRAESDQEPARRLQVSLRMIRSEDGGQIWSRVVYPETTDPSEHPRIARQVAQQIGAELLGDVPEAVAARWAEEDSREQATRIATASPPEETDLPTPSPAPAARAASNQTPAAVTELPGGVPTQPTQQPPAAPGALRIEFSSESPDDGTLIISAGGKTLLERAFEAPKRSRLKRLLPGRGDAAEPVRFSERIEVPREVTSLRVAVLIGGRAVRDEQLAVDFTANDTYRLGITVGADGQVRTGSTQ